MGPHRQSFAGGASLPLLVHIHAQCPQLFLRHLDLRHQLLVRLGDVVEGQDAPAEAGEEVRAESDQEPEGKLFGSIVSCPLCKERRCAGLGEEARTTGIISVWIFAGRGTRWK